MKNRKILAVALSISIILSSFSQVFISYAQSNDLTQQVNSIFNKKAPEPNITDIEPELSSNKIEASSNIEASLRFEAGSNKIEASSNVDSIKDHSTLYNSSKINSNQDVNKGEDVYNFTEDQVDELLKQGYSLNDIIEADKIGNELYIDPISLLKTMKDTNKSLAVIKEDIQKERKNEAGDYLLNKYQKEYKKLGNEGLDEDDILELLAYLDANDISLTNNMVKKFKKNKANVLCQNINSISKDTKLKYKISDKDAKLLTEDIIESLENISEKTNTPMKDVIKSYLKSCNKKGE